MNRPAPLRIRSFRRLWLASLCSAVGSFVQTVAASWLMFELTGSPLLVSAMFATTTAPLLLLALPAGAVADMVDRRKVVVAAQAIMAASAAAMAVLVLLDLVSPARLLGLGLLLGVGQAVNLPAWQAMVPDLVPRDLVAGAVALNSAAFNVARTLGPALGGLIVATAGPGAAFALNTVTYLVLIAAVASLGWRFANRASDTSMRSAIAIGLRYARFTPAFRSVLLLAAGFALTSAVVQALLPNLTAEAFGGGAATYGLLLGAMGLGALAGAASRQRGAVRLGPHMVPAAIVGFGLTGMLVGTTRNVVVAGLGLGLAGILWVWILATLNATCQLLAPSWVRGRLMSLYTMSFVGVVPLGALLAGAVGSAVGSGAAFVALSAAVSVIGVLAFSLPLPSLEALPSPEPTSGPARGPHPANVDGGPVMVANHWTIDEADLPAFLEVMSQLRRVRLRTGAYRWRLYRDVADPHRMSEVYLLVSWSEHLRQHERLDAASVELVQRATAFDRAQGPQGRHLVAVDVIDPEARPDWQDLVGGHADLHRADGSVPLEESGDRTEPPAVSR